MTVRTLGDFIEEDQRGTKGLQREGIDDPEFRKSASSVFYPHTTLSQNRLRFGNDINLFSLATFEEFYSKLRFKSVEDSEAVFSPTGESSANELFWKPERSLQWPNSATFAGAINNSYGENRDSLGDALKSVFDLYTQNLQLEDPLQNQKLTGKEPIDSDLSRGLENLLNTKNRFNPGPNSPFYDSSTRQITGNGTTFVYANSAVLRDKTEGLLQLEGEFGKYRPGKIPRTLNDIRRFAVSNLIAATGHKDFILNTDTKEPSRFNKQIGSIQIDPFAYGQSALPGMDKIDLDKMGIAESSLINDSGGSENANEGEEDSRNRRSFGQMNSPAEPFHGQFNMGMIMPALVSLLLVFVILFIFKAIVDAIESGAGWAALLGSTKDKPLKNKQVRHILDPKTDIIKYRYGENTAYSAPDAAESVKSFFEFILHLVKDALDWPFWHKYNFFLNSYRGILMFMGIGVKFNEETKTSDADAKEIFPALVALVKNPGYFAVIVKQVMREFDNIANAFKAFGDVSFLNFSSVISTILSLFEVIRESTTWKFILVLSDMGEQAARATLDSTGANWTGGDGSAHRGKNTTAEDPNVFRSMHRTEYNGGHTSAIALSNFSSLLLDKQQFDSASKGLIVNEENPEPTMVFENNIYKHKNKDSAKIPKEIVMKYEELLNSEYCPFYIQDLRNNEIVNIPAFISSLSDNFSPEYSSTDGYGRTDPVRVYTKTSRQIQIGFKMVAMNSGDHSKMWFSINRLIAMLYPQRSSGRLVKGKKGSQYIQPFSSVPTTSPLVRLRLGDLYRTNFSDSSFARMLGYHRGKVIPPGTNLSDEEKAKFQKQKREMDTKLKKVREKIQGEFDEIVSNAELKGDDKLEKIQSIIKKYTDEDNAKFAGAVLVEGGANVTLRTVKPSPSGLLGKIAGAAAGIVAGSASPPEEGGEAFGTTVGQTYGKLVGIFAHETQLYAAIHTNIFSDVESIANLMEELKSKEESLKEKFNFDNEYKEIIENMQLKLKRKEEYKKLKDDFDRFNLDKDKIKKAHNLQKNKPEEHLCFVVPFVGEGQNNISIFAHHTKVLKELDGDQDLQDVLKILKKIQDVETPMEFARKSPFYRSFRESGGYGLAGVITQFSLDYGDSTWEIKKGSKAPKKVDVTMSFEPIHDLAPGLDTDGRMMNPIFPVGNSSGGDKNPWIQESSIADPAQTAKVAELRYQLLGVPKDPEPPSFPGMLM